MMLDDVRAGGLPGMCVEVVCQARPETGVILGWVTGGPGRIG